jgi:hypothetical protein
MSAPDREPPMPTFPRSAFALLLLAAPALAQRGTPIPLEKDSTNREDGVTWIVEGRQRIPSHVTLTSLRACTIQGGEGAVLEVEGELDLRAATGGHCVIDGVWVEPVAGCKGLTLLNVRFRGDGGLRTAGDGQVDVEATLNDTNFENQARLDLGLFGGKVLMMGCASDAPVTFRGLTSEKQKRNALELQVDSCSGRERALRGGLVVEGVKEVLVRNCDLGGEESKLVDCGELEFFGNLVRSRRIEFRRATPKSFNTTKIGSCDFRCKELLLWQPMAGADPEKVRLTQCWFDDLLLEPDIRAQMVSDHERDATSGALADFVKIQGAPLGLGGAAR